VIPADSGQAATAIRHTADLPRPVYYSLGKDNRQAVTNLDGRFEPGRIQLVRTGSHVALISMGSISLEAVAAAEQLAGVGIDAAVAIVSGFNPDPVLDISRLLAGIPFAVSVEAQTKSGGLGAFVSTVIASEGLPCRLKILAVNSSPDGTSGSQADRWRKHGLDRDSIVRSVLALTGGRPA